MKKLTAGIFATLMVIVTAGVARADIASTEYVNGQLNTKESINNKATTSATVAADAEDRMFPTVARMEKNVQDAINGLDVTTKLNGKEDTSNKATENANVTTEQRDVMFPTVARMEKNVQDAINGLDITTKLNGKEDISNKANVADVENATWATATDKDTKYLTAAATEKIVDGAINGLDITTKLDGKEDISNKANVADVENATWATATDKDTKYLTAAATEKIVDGAINGLDITTKLSGKEDTSNKATENANVTTEQRDVMFPTVARMEKKIQDEVSAINTSLGNKQDKSDLLTKLAALDTSVCNTAGTECVLKYNNGTFGLEVITRGGTTTSSDTTQGGSGVQQ